MRLTNKRGLPELFARAIRNDPYVGGGDITVTQLIGPPRIRHLLRKHGDELEEDVGERVWSLLGQAVHAVLERAGEEGAFHEERLETDVLGWKVTGQTDRYDGTAVVDAKVASAWSLLPGEPVKPEWECQLNCYAQLWRENGFEVGKLQILAILRDWNRREAQRSSSYPQRPAVLRDVPLWDADETLRYMRSRVRLHQALDSCGPGEGADSLVQFDCSDAERWARPDKWAVMLRGRKRAKRLLGSEWEAEELAEELERTTEREHYVELRPGESVRCESYCPVRTVCPQRARMRTGRARELRPEESGT